MFLGGASRVISGLVTDKAAHGYLPTYLQIAAQIGTAGKVCEIGVADGGSLELWQTLFPHGLVVGVDDDSYTTRQVTFGEAPTVHVGTTWPPGTVKVVASQDDPTLPGRLREIASGFDLIVDDASHDGALTRRTWELLWPLVAPGGWYVIEDWQIALNGSRDRSMLDTVQGLLRLLDSPAGEADSIEYRYGLAAVRRSGAAA